MLILKKTHFLFVFLTLALSWPTFAARIGIFGCSHGDTKLLLHSIKSMKQKGMTDLIGNGDFVTFPGPVSLNEQLQAISQTSGLKKKHIFFMPGNWEGTQDNSRLWQKFLFELYGTLITEKYSEHGFVKTSGKTIQVAHFPQHPIPAHMIPQREYLYRYFKGQAHLVLTMAKKKEIGHPVNLDLNIIGHTHIRGYFYDQKSKVLTINPGCLTTKRKNPKEINSFAIYDTVKEQVEFYNAEVNPVKLLEVVPIKDLNNDKAADLTFDSQDFGICHLQTDDLNDIIKKDDDL